MCANWTRCSGRTSTLAPASSSRNGAFGTGTTIASAGRCTPRARLKREQRGGQRRAGRAAGDERVGPPLGDRLDGAHDRRVGRAADGARRIRVLGDRDRRVDDLDALRTRRPARRPGRTAARACRRQRPARRRAPPRQDPGRRRSRRPRRSPSAGALVVVVVIVVVRDVHDRATAVAAAVRAHPVRAARLVALRAGVHRGRGDLVLRAALARARMRLLLLRNGHGRRRRVADGELQLRLGGGIEACGGRVSRYCASGPVR